MNPLFVSIFKFFTTRKLFINIYIIKMFSFSCKASSKEEVENIIVWMFLSIGQKYLIKYFDGLLLTLTFNIGFSFTFLVIFWNIHLQYNWESVDLSKNDIFIFLFFFFTTYTYGNDGNHIARPFLFICPYFLV